MLIHNRIFRFDHVESHQRRYLVSGVSEKMNEWKKDGKIELLKVFFRKMQKVVNFQIFSCVPPDFSK